MTSTTEQSPGPDGTRYVDGKLKIQEECFEMDREKPKDQVAATLMKTVANSITEMFTFEEDDVRDSEEMG